MCDIIMFDQSCPDCKGATVRQGIDGIFRPCECQTTYSESGLSDYELELEKIVEKIKFSTTIEGISILKNYIK